MIEITLYFSVSSLNEEGGGIHKFFVSAKGNISTIIYILVPV